MLPLLLVISIGTFIPLRLLKNLYLARMRIQDPPQGPFFLVTQFWRLWVVKQLQ